MENVKQLFLEFIATYNVEEKDLDLKGGYSGTLSQYQFLRNIFKVYKHIVSGNVDKSIFQFKISLDEIDFSFDPIELSDEELVKVLERRDIVKKVKELYNNKREDIYSPLLKIAEQHDFFKGETLDEEEIPADILMLVSDWMDKKYLKKYVLKQGVTEIPENLTQFIVSKELYLSDNLNYFLENFNKEYSDDIARVTVFFKIEKEIEYSYFMFILNYKDHVIAFSDLLLFENPHMVTASRSPRKKVENKHDDSCLPYQLIDNIGKIREDSSTLATTSNNVEFHKLKWKGFSQVERMFSLLVIKDLVNNLSIGDAKLLVSAEQHINQKLLESKDIDINGFEDDTTFDEWSETGQEYVKDLIDNMVDESESTELMKLSYDIIVNNDTYDSSMLAPVEIHDAHNKWHFINEQKKQIVDKIGKQYNGWNNTNKEKDEHDTKIKELQDMMKPNLEKILKKLMIAENLHFNPNDDDTILDFQFKQRTEKGYLGQITYIGAQYGWGFYDEEEKKEKERCPILPKYKGSTEYHFKIRHYKQLMYLLDCERKDLPKFFRCYKTFYLVPGHGNTILSNVHPLATITDPCSREQPNGMIITLNISKRGYNKVLKEIGKDRPKNMTIDLEGNIVLDINKDKIKHSIRI